MPPWPVLPPWPGMPPLVAFEVTLNNTSGNLPRGTVLSASGTTKGYAAGTIIETVVAEQLMVVGAVVPVVAVRDYCPVWGPLTWDGRGYFVSDGTLTLTGPAVWYAVAGAAGSPTTTLASGGVP